jgi:hypothetical protein
MSLSCVYPPPRGERGGGFILDYIICIKNKRVDGYREEMG